MTPPTPASLPRRLAALGYEALLLAAVTCIAFIPAAAANMALHTVPLAAETAVALIILAIWWGYFRLCWHSPRGQTLPMKVWRLRLQTPAGSRPTLPRLRLRFLWAATLLLLLPLASFGILRQLTPLPPQTLAGLALAWWILPFGFALIHPSRQFLYDYLAGTVLAEAAPETKK
ncbi:RDD family protein [Eikenella sp. S3360]|uniref:RDD family protein n=1 Tax=Eikenella glucosivorans TaxID=2766967 RepID=A0ABS0N975_9NEIS|nr:RDD family protein [Eikenella glucosivorans]MBH5328849.1 RDD family protein [Eikenella glucosivorans]